MESPASFFSASGRIAPKPFSFAVTGVYLVSFLSQFLLAAPVMERAGIIPFVLVQVATIWSWYALHARRLRDAELGAGMALAISILYGLGVVLLLLIITLLVAPAKDTGVDHVAAGFLEFFLLFYLLARLTGDPTLGIFGDVMLGVMVFVILPMLLSVGFTLWAVLRPRRTASA